MIKKISLVLTFIMIIAGFFVLVSSAGLKNQSKKCRNFVVLLDERLSFVDSARVVSQVYAQFDSLPGKPLNLISLEKIEAFINQMHFVHKSDVYLTVDGDIYASITQRKPVARIINKYNESFYIDIEGKLMKTSPYYTARVPVVAGYIETRFSTVVDLYNQQNSDQENSDKVLQDLLFLLDYISEDSFLKAWIDQIYITRNGEFEMIPKNGSHTIEFGRLDYMEEKFEKLVLFYQNGLSQKGWNHYQRVNLKFKNQIVCSK
ncbi:MAG: cell division protein FtsQ/DivIB [Bacteroidota bacterium]